MFDFYPVLVDYSGVGATQEGGGGTFGLPELEPQEEGVKQRYYHPYTAERLDETVRANGCTVLYLQRSTISLCRAIRTCLPTTWPLRRRAYPALPRNGCRV